MQKLLHLRLKTLLVETLAKNPGDQLVGLKQILGACTTIISFLRVLVNFTVYISFQWSMKMSA